MLGRSAGLFERQYRLVASFGQIGGLIQGATVRLAGVAVGHVGEIRLPEAGGAKVRVELLIARRVQDRIRADSVGADRDAGAPRRQDHRRHASGARARRSSRTAPSSGRRSRSTRPASPSRARSSSRTWSSSRRSSGRPSRASRRARPGPTSPRRCGRSEAWRPRSSGGRACSTGSSTTGSSGRRSPTPGETLRQVGETVRRIDRVLADPRTAGLAGEAERTLAEARAAAERVNRILREVEEGRGTLHALIYDEGRVLKDLEGVARAGRARSSPASSGAKARSACCCGIRTRRAPSAGVVTAADGLAQAVDRARTEDSVLRALLADPALAGDLRDTARSFREVTGRIARGEGVLGALTQPGGEESIKQLTQALARLGQLAEGLGGDAKLGETLADLRQAMADLRAITGRIEGGRGHARRPGPGPDGLREPRRVPGGRPAERAPARPHPRRDRPRDAGAGRRAARRRRDTAPVRPASVYRCQACGFQAGKWYGRCPDCGEFNTIVEERTGVPRGSGGSRRAPSAGAARAHGGAGPPGRRVGRGGRPRPLGRGRAGSGPRRRRRARLAGPDRRRPGHRQVDPPPPGLGRARGDGGAGPLRVGRGVGRPGQAPRGAARARRVGAPHPGRDAARGHRGARGGDRAAGPDRRLDPDRVPRGSRVGAREREPGARVRRAAHAPGQGPGHRGLPGRPRHQGGRARRPPRARAPGRHRALLRGRAARDVPRPPGRQEPVRLDQRDRRLRDDRRRAPRSGEPLGDVPGRAPARRGGLRDHGDARGHAAAAPRAAGARHAGPLRDAAPHRARRGLQSSVPAAGDPGKARRHPAAEPGRVRQRGGGRALPGARGGPGDRGGVGLELRGAPPGAGRGGAGGGGAHGRGAGHRRARDPAPGGRGARASPRRWSRGRAWSPGRATR